MRKPAVLGALAVAALAAVVLVATLLVVPAVTASPDVDACRASSLVVPTSTWSAPGWTRAENRHSGTSDWRLHVSKQARGVVRGFLNQISIAPREPITLFVDARQTWRWSAYRLGYYGGAGGRLYGSSCWYAPTRQPPPVTLRSTRTLTERWKPTLRIRASWPPGVYLLKLTSVGGRESYVPLVVRSPSAAGRTVFMFSAMTMQAYNRWGGRSLYIGPDLKARSRAFADSFDRPFDDHLAHQILAFEQPLVADGERLGLPLAYLTDIDVATRPHVLVGARTLMTDGHAEYWTLGERQAVIDARNRGTNLLFFGANQLWWQVRLARTSLGPDRLVICFKAAVDPITGTHPELRSTHFRSLARPLPESWVVGVQYSGLGADAPFRVYRPDFFAFAHTGARLGSVYPGLVGQEIDTVNPGTHSPPTLEIVGRSLATCHEVPCLSEATYYTVPSGAAVWAAGTDGWVNALGADILRLGVTPATRAFVQEVTDNLLLEFARGPAGRAHPARPNVTAADGPPAAPKRPLDGDID